MIAADFLGDPTGIRIGHALPNGPTAGSCGPFLFGCNSAQAARHLHGSTKLAGEGRLWMMRCAPSISIVAQSLCMAVILPPSEGHRYWALAPVGSPRKSAAIIPFVNKTVMCCTPSDLDRRPVALHGFVNAHPLTTAARERSRCAFNG